MVPALRTRAGQRARRRRAGVHADLPLVDGLRRAVQRAQLRAPGARRGARQSTGDGADDPADGRQPGDRKRVRAAHERGCVRHHLRRRPARHRDLPLGRPHRCLHAAGRADGPCRHRLAGRQLADRGAAARRRPGRHSDPDRPRAVASRDRRGRGAAGLPAPCERLAVRGRPPGEAGAAAQGRAVRPGLQRSAERDGVERRSCGCPCSSSPVRPGGLVRFPAPRMVPSGHELAADFQALTYVRPMGAPPLRTPLVVGLRDLARQRTAATARRSRSGRATRPPGLRRRHGRHPRRKRPLARVRRAS